MASGATGRLHIKIVPPSAELHHPPPGASASQSTTSIQSGRQMATGMNHQESSSIEPSHNYPSPNEAHGPQGSYDYHRSQRAFEEEEDLQMANTLSHDMHHNLGAQLASAAGMSNVHGHEQDMAISPSAAGAPGMAPPPQTPGQPPLGGPPMQQSGAENVQEGGATTDSTRRKRSKVSRACDECRRKKVPQDPKVTAFRYE